MSPAGVLRDDALGVLPYRALLRAESVADRQRMVMALYESGRPDADAVLRQALRDPDERIRLLAAQALERISEKFEKAIQIQRRRVEAKPNDPNARLELARLIYERALGAGQSAGTERASFAEAAMHLKAALDHIAEPRLTSARLQLGRVLARLGQAREALRILSLVPPEAADFHHARFLMAELQLALGDVAACKAEMKKLAGRPLKNGMRGAVAFWEPRP